MADTKISALTTLTGADAAQNDVIAIVDTSTATTKKITREEFFKSVDYIALDTANGLASPTDGQLTWDATYDTLAVGLNGGGVVMHVGQDTYYRVRNNTGSTIPAGTVCRFAGSLGNSGILLVAPFIANNTVDSHTIMGISAESIANGTDGLVTNFGEVRGINTSAFTDGAILYASTTVSGGLTATKPSLPNNIISVAAVVNAANNGTLFVRPIIESSIANTVSMSGGGTVQEYVGFATRPAFVTWASGKTPAVGTVIRAAGYAYRYIGTGTSISDLAGWVPDDQINAAHWGVDTTGATNDAAKLTAAFLYAKGKDLYLPAGTIAFTGTLSTINTNNSNVIGAGIGKTILTMTAPSTTYVQAFDWTASRCKWSDFTFNFPTLSNCVVAFANFSGGDNRFERIRWVGGVTGGATASHSAYVLNHSTSADVDGLTVVDCEEDSTVFGFLKTNANTRATKRVSIIRHRSKNCWKSPMHNINSPNGIAQDITMQGGVFEQDENRGLFPIVVGVATGNNVSISGLKGRGFWGDFVHVEEMARIVSISDCSAELSAGNFLTLTANNVSGSWERPEQITITNVQAEQINVQSGRGLWLVFDANPISSATNVVASSGIFKNFTKGIEVGARGEDNVRLSDFQLIGCGTGVYYTGDATLDVKDFTFVDCGIAVECNRGGLVENCTFYGNNQTHVVTAGLLQFKNPKFNYGLEALTASGSRWFRLLNRVTRSQATVALKVFQSNTNKVDIIHQINWDGTTETSTLLQSVASGAFAASIVLVNEASALAITAGGTGYTVGDVLTVQGGTLETGGTRTTATVATVSAGVVTGVTLTNVGEWATPPAGAAATTGGTGTGCTLTLTTVKAICANVFSASALTAHIDASIDGSVYVI